MRKYVVITAFVVVVIGLAMNLQYAFNDYGIKTNNLHPDVLAQENSDSGSGSGSGGTGGSAGGTGDDCMSPGTPRDYCSELKGNYCYYDRPGDDLYKGRIISCKESKTYLQCEPKSCITSSSCYSSSSAPKPSNF